MRHQIRHGVRGDGAEDAGRVGRALTEITPDGAVLAARDEAHPLPAPAVDAIAIAIVPREQCRARRLPGGKLAAVDARKVGERFAPRGQHARAARDSYMHVYMRMFSADMYI